MKTPPPPSQPKMVLLLFLYQTLIFDDESFSKVIHFKQEAYGPYHSPKLSKLLDVINSTKFFRSEKFLIKWNLWTRPLVPKESFKSYNKSAPPWPLI